MDFVGHSSATAVCICSHCGPTGSSGMSDCLYAARKCEHSESLFPEEYAEKAGKMAKRKTFPMLLNFKQHLPSPLCQVMSSFFLLVIKTRN